MNSYALLVLDSCRFDAMRHVWRTLRFLPRLGKLRRAYTYSTWTLTSHVAYALGRLPWVESRRSASSMKRHVSDLREWYQRLGVADIRLFRDDLDFRLALRDLGYQIDAFVAANPLGPETPFRHFVDTLVSVGKEGNSLMRIVERIPRDGLRFMILNTTETHYPYFDGGYAPTLSRLLIPGFRGQLRHARADARASLPRFRRTHLRGLFARQCSAIKYLDGQLEHLACRLPPGTFLTVTSDHGDCFGEDGFVGHGEVAHVKALEVPLIEGRL